MLASKDPASDHLPNMVAQKNVLSAMASWSFLTESKAVGHIFKSIFKCEIILRSSNDVWAGGKFFEVFYLRNY